VTDGRSFVDRETDPRVRSVVRPQPGSLTFRQITQTRRWKLVKTWVTDPRRATVLANVRFESFTRRPLQVYLLADPAPGDDGNDDRGRTEDRALLAWDDTAASAVMAEPRLRRATSGYAGSASDPWRDLEADLSLDDRFTASAPGNVVQAARTRLTGRRGHREMTLAIGFGADAATARRTAQRSLATGFWPAGIRYATGWSRYLASLNRPLPPGLAARLLPRRHRPEGGRRR